MASEASAKGSEGLDKVGGDEGKMNITLDGQGLVPAVAQDINTGQVLMLGYICLLYTSPSPRD